MILKTGMTSKTGMNSKAGWILAGLLLLISAPAVADPVNLLALIPQAVRQYGGYATQMFVTTFKNLQVKLDVDLDHAVGWADVAEGILLVPAKGLSEERMDKESGTQYGSGLCYLFMSQRFDLLDGAKPVEKSKLRHLRWLSVDGVERDSTPMLVTVKETPGRGKELCLYGPGKEPVVRAKFEKAAGSDGGEFAASQQINADGNIEVAISIFGKYSAKVLIHPGPPVGPSEDGSVTSTAGGSKRKMAARRGVKRPEGVALLQFDAARTGYLPDGKSLPKRPKVAWRFPADSEGATYSIGDPLVSQGVVYFGDAGGRLHALAADTGTEKWVQEYPGGAILAAPAIANKHLFLSSNQNVRCVELENGKNIWSHDLPSARSEVSVLPVGDALFVASSDGNVYALKAADGTEIWHQEVTSDAPPEIKGFNRQNEMRQDEAMRPNSSASDGTLLFQPIYDQSRVVALDLKTGKRRWSYAAQGWVTGQPAVAENRVLVSSMDLFVHCIDRDTGKPVWAVPTGGTIQASPAVANGRVYCATCSSRVFCIDLDSGKIPWSRRLETESNSFRWIYCAPLVTNDTVYIATADGELVALDAASGQTRWSISVASNLNLSNAGIATDGNRLFVVSRTPYQFANSRYALFAIGD